MNGAKLLLINITLASLLAGCSSLSKVTELYSGKPEVIGRQPLHLIPTRDQFRLKGPVKKVTYLQTRPRFSGPETDEISFEFDIEGKLTRIEGDPDKFKSFGFLKYYALPANTEITYGSKGELEEYKSIGENHRYEYKGGVKEFGEETGNIKSFFLKHTKNPGTSSEKKYNTLEYFVYSGNRYMSLQKDNRKREETTARIYEYDENDHLIRVYLHENNYPLDKKPSEAMTNPKGYRFTIEKEFEYDHQGRISRVKNVTKEGQQTATDRLSYVIRTDLPKHVTSVDGNGAQQYRIKYSDYEKDSEENWTKRKVTTTYRRGDKEGFDERQFEYYVPKS